MKLGAQLPVWDEHAGADELRRFVTGVDQLGLDSIWLGDHVLLPDAVADLSTYPYLWRFGDDMRELFPSKAHPDALAMVGFICGVSLRLEVGLGVLVLPLRNPMIAAKQLSTLDLVSGGRVRVGLGAGWLREEFDALGVPFDERGPRMEEALQVMTRLWTGERTSFEGRFSSFSDMYCRPARSPALWFGGHSRRALERCARWGSGWYAVELSPEEFAERSAQLDEQLARVGRAPEEVERALTRRFRLRPDGIDETHALLGAYRAAGCDQIVAQATASRTMDDNLARLEHLRAASPVP
jgi:probable F420-dependent oxidoreductase